MKEFIDDQGVVLGNDRVIPVYECKEGVLVFGNMFKIICSCGEHPRVDASKEERFVCLDCGAKYTVA